MVEENGITQISVKRETKKILDKRKIDAEHNAGHPITWDDLLLDATK
jgi:hypothetical protein